MAMNEQAKPLAPAGYQIHHDHEDQAATTAGYINTQMLHRRRRCLIQCCGCITALLLVAVVAIIVIATVYHITNPSIKTNSITIQRLEQLLDDNNGSSSSTSSSSSGVVGNGNITLISDVSVKNPNHNSFKYSNTTTCLYYGGVMVGEGHIPSGVAKARRTMRMNVTVNIIPEKILTVPSFRNDVLSGFLNISSYTRIDGRLKVLNIVRKYVVVKMNCSISYNILSGHVQDKCRGQDD